MGCKHAYCKRLHAALLSRHCSPNVHLLLQMLLMTVLKCPMQYSDVKNSLKLDLMIVTEPVITECVLDVWFAV